jgi:hydroxymethylpyrimidine/phosphomethylpyrimidine kinase
MDERPGVLCIGGHDPTGGAGIQADIETLTALGVRPFSLVTCLTTQDTHDVAGLLPTPVADFRQQFDRLLADIHPDAIKIGLLGSIDVASFLAERLAAFDRPVVIDPVLRAGGGEPLAGEAVRRCLRDRLVGRATLLTPNLTELTQLTELADAAAAAQSLLDRGAAGVLVTGADAAADRRDDQVSNTLYVADAPSVTWNWPRLRHVYHGSGCTLASACCAGLAHGNPLAEAVAAAQAFTWHSLARGCRPGAGQYLPDRSA